jgi:hypothetical protein
VSNHHKLFVERSRDEKLLFTPFTSAPLGEHSAGLINCSSSEAETRIPGPPLGFARGATTINCSSSEAETRTYYSHPSPRLRSVSTRLRSVSTRLRSVSTRLRSGCNHHALFVERSRGSISDLLSLIFRNLNSSKTYDTKYP